MKTTVAAVTAAFAISAAAAGYHGNASANQPCPSTATVAQCAAHYEYVRELAINPPGPDRSSWYVRLLNDIIRAMGN
jgi:hypothetical protein